MRPRHPLAIRSLALAVFLAALSWFASDWLAPDGCLDSGGSFNYEAWTCSHTEQYQYIDVPFAERVSSWVFALGTVASICLFALARRSKQK